MVQGFDSQTVIGQRARLLQTLRDTAVVDPGTLECPVDPVEGIARCRGVGGDGDTGHADHGEHR